MKKIGNYLFWAVMAVVWIYLLYDKGYILANYESVSVNQAYTMLKDERHNVTLLDVRSEEEFNKDGRLEGAMLIPLPSLEQKIGLLNGSKEKMILVYCRSGNRSATASRILADEGFRVFNVEGGIKAWKAGKLPLLE